MRLYIYIDQPDYAELATPISQELSAWIGSNKKHIQLVNRALAEYPEQADNELGIDIQLETANALKKPLEYLYGLARTHKIDFVVGIHDPESGAREDVCYFGLEEGRPDPDEVALYLGL